MANIVTEHDGLLTICTGSSRKTRVWKQKQISWSQLLQRLSTTKRTSETQAQYFKLGKARQDEIKDVGGFVGGELENGKRTALSVVNRKLITLDADFAEQNLWEKIITFFDNAACVYSTHKHTKEKPRLRLVIPLNRAVSSDEYQAISRKVAESFGIENFDDTTYQPHRLMYFPSTSSDAEFYFQWQDGEFLNADKVLTEYDDWQDQTTWARSSRSKEIVKNVETKAEDPLTKAGLIGAFCRAYAISEAIEKFLPDIYEQCGDKDRYTFKAGTTSGGAIVYQDKWLYSFHATDPANNGHINNAFDLVRIHKFGELDEGKEHKELNTLPSYTKMLNFCSKDDKVKVLMTEEAIAEFDDLGEEKQDMSWSKKLKRHEKTGQILSNRYNVTIILENDVRIKNCFAFDVFAQNIAIIKPLFWRNKEISNLYWTDADDFELRVFLENNFGLKDKGSIEDAFIHVAYKQSFHSVRNYLRGLKWDGVERMEKLFINYLGAEDSKYTRIITRKSLIAAVARVMKPGIKFDNMIVLEGAQGIGKSKLILKLGKGWTNDTIDDLTKKDAYEGLRGKWLILLDELQAMNKSDSDATKKFISKEVDSFRVSYGKRIQDFPRQCVFFGTTNVKLFLKDKTGNRRFFPIHCDREKQVKAVSEWINDTEFDAEIDQIWAEAFEAWNKGESLWVGAEMEKIAAIIQEQHTKPDPLIGAIEMFLNNPVPSDWYAKDLRSRIEFNRGLGVFDAEDKKNFVSRNKICVLEIWVELLDGDIKKLSQYKQQEIFDALLKIEGWEQHKNYGEKLFFGSAYGMQKAFVRKSDAKNICEKENFETKADDVDESDLPF